MKRNILSKLAAVITAAAVSASLAFTSYADEPENYDIADIITEAEGGADTLPEPEPAPAPAKEEKQAAAGAGGDERVVSVPAKQIRLISKMDNTINLGESFQIKNTFKPSKSDDYVTYKSLNRTVAIVSEDGVVTGVGAGSTIIRLKATSGAKANVYVEVLQGDAPAATKAESVEMLDKNIMLRKGKTAKVQYLLYPLGVTDTVTFSSDNPAAAEVSGDGTITANETGSAVITVTASSGVSAECYVTVYSGQYRGIDVSKWQGDINWKKVGNAGVDFAMIRSSFGSSDTDIKLAQNVAGCEKNGIPYGFYHYTYASSVSAAKKEARFFLRTIRKYSPEYPIVLDIEEEMYKSMSRRKVTDIICAFMEELEDAGYYASIYSYAKFFNDHADMKRLKKYDIWVACWGDTERLNSFYDYHYGMWQYSSTGKVPGIDGEVDLDYAFKNYANVIKKAGLNKSGV